MARTKNKRSDLKAFSYKIKLKNGEKFLDKPEFEIQERKGDKYEVIPERGDYVSGNLVGVEPREYVYNNSPIRSFTVTLQDDAAGEIYFVNVPFNGLGRGLANSLLALKGFENVSISLYASKPKVAGGKVYPSVSLRQNDERVMWKYTNDELPKPAEVTFKGQVQRDWTAQEVFLAEELKKLGASVRQNSVSTKVATQEAPAPSAPEGEDVPF